MSITVQDGIPKTLTVGDAVSFKIQDRNFPAPTWTSKVIFKDQSGGVKTFAGSASGSDHLFALTNAQAAKLVAGQNLVCLQFSDGTNRQSTDWAEIEVLPDPASSQSPSFAQQQVTLLQAVIQKLQGSKFQSVNFNGQSFTQNNLLDYQKQLTYWEARLIQERKRAAAKRGIQSCSPVSPSFLSPSESIPPFNRVPQ